MARVEFALPDVGEGIAEAEVVEWRVAEGDQVREDQELVAIQTDKAIVVIPCPTTGVVTRLCAQPGDTVRVGSTLAVFEPDRSADGTVRSGKPVAETADLGAAAGPAGSVAAAATPESIAPGTPAHAADRPLAAPAHTAGLAAPAHAADRPLAAPATRRLARELGVALEAVTGSGPQGRILREDVERAAGAAPAAGGPSLPGAAPAAGGPLPGAPPPPEPASASSPAGAPAPADVVPLRGVRRAIARNLAEAWLEVPRIIDYREVDATALMRARARLKQRALDRGDDALARAMTPTPLIVAAAVHALRRHPYVNSSVDLEREEITLHRRYDIGIATAAPDGLIVPVLHDAGEKSVREIASGIADLVRAARERRLAPGDLAGATFTVNNYGAMGVWLGTPIVRPPEVCNLGVGAVRDQVVAVDGVPAVRPTLALAVAADHRVLDGHTLAAFVTDVVELLEEPLLLLEDPL